MLKRQHRFDQTRNARRSVEMTNIRLDRTDGTTQLSLIICIEHSVQRCNFNRVADGSGSAMRFDITDCFRSDAGDRECARNYLSLS